MGWVQYCTECYPRRKLLCRCSSLLLLCFTACGIQDISEETAIATVHEAFNQGINYYDTSPFYGDGLSEIVSLWSSTEYFVNDQHDGKCQP